MRATKFISGSININILLAFAFGCFFLLVLLVFSVIFRDISDFAKQVFVTVLSVSAAGVGAVIPGLLNVKLPFAEAGGALAIFLLVFLNKPAIVDTAEIISDWVAPPEIDPEPVVEDYLDNIQARDLNAAWDLLDEGAKGLVVRDKEEFVEIYNNFLNEYGIPVDRKKVNTAGASSPDGFPSGVYRSITYIVKYSEGDCFTESVLVRAKDSNSDWIVYQHPVSLPLAQCPQF